MPSLQLPPIFDTLQLPLLFLTNILALAIGPRHRILQLGFSVPVLAILAAQSLYRDYSGAWGTPYALNCGVMSVLATYFDCVVLRSPDREGWTKLSRRVGFGGAENGVKEREVGSRDDGFPRDNGGVVKSKTVGIDVSAKTARVMQRSAPSTFKSRLWWAVRLSCTIRYTGWSCEVKNVPIEVDDAYPRW